MTLLQILRRLRDEAPTCLTLEEECYLQGIERRRNAGESLGRLLLDEGITPEAALEFAFTPDIAESLQVLFRKAAN